MGNEITQPAGNYYDKYRTKNPIARWLMQGFFSNFDALAKWARTETVDAIEIGCGEGELSIRLARAGMRVMGCDIASEAVEEARVRAAGLDVPFFECSVEQAAEQFRPAGLVVCCEVLEHLDDPVSALAVLDSLSTRYVLVSVPREPLWRVLNVLRLRYIPALGNTPGHVQHWSRRSFTDLLSSQFDIVAIKSPLPWTMVLCRVRR